MAEDFLGKILLTFALLGSVALLFQTFNFDLLQTLIPQYAIWVKRGMGIAAGYLIYSMYRR